ncbi:MAG: T9SS type A sorting domain-containing protein, partial [Flavobacteriales bacterium]|nr:T9SS type A sorting domain-containing protein [Flavobacteriales bacterium]
YDPTATIDDGSCVYDDIEGCTDPTACNYDQFATIDDGSCEYESCAGCTDDDACNYDDDATLDDGSCDYSCYGCTDPDATNYDSTATIDDGSCVYGEIFGCTDPTACNYDQFATIDNGTCEYETCAGCTDSTALNYDSEATLDDGSCIFDCVFPMIEYTTFCEDGDESGFYVEMDINDLGNGAPYLVAKNENDDEIQLTFNGIIELGPFTNESQVLITVSSIPLEGCVITSPLLQDNCVGDGIVENAFAPAVIYPNPNSGTFFFETGDHIGRLTFDVYDLTGKLVYAEEMNVTAGERRQIVLQGDVAFGTYLVRVNSDGKSEQFRLIIR